MRDFIGVCLHLFVMAFAIFGAYALVYGP